MRVFSLVTILLIPATLFIKHNGERKSNLPPIMEATCAYPNGRPSEPVNEVGRCYGYDPCHVCKNCSSCGHCNSGGSCGMCGKGKSHTYQNSRGSRNSGNHQNGNSRSGSNNANAFYNSNESAEIWTVYLPAPATVNTEILNIRKGPGTEFDILGQLAAGDSVIVTETAGEKWVKIEVTIWDGKNFTIVEGYVFKNYLSF